MARILIMDDDVKLTLQWTAELKNAGHSVEITANATEAQEILAIDRFDVLIADLVVQPQGRPPDGGQRLLQRILHHPDPHVREMPVIGVSGFQPLGSDELAKKLFSGFGVTKFLPKPFTTTDLLAAVTAVLPNEV